MLSCLIVLSHNIKLVSIFMLHLYCDLIIMVAVFHLLERCHCLIIHEYILAG